MAGKMVFAGSCLTAMTMMCQRFPTISETVIASGFIAETGGEGTNQALAAAKLGSEVNLIGCVGDDAFGQSVLQKTLGGIVAIPTKAQVESFIRECNLQ